MNSTADLISICEEKYLSNNNSIINFPNDESAETILINWIVKVKENLAIVSILMLFSLMTVFGNSLVILAVMTEPHLYNPTNYFITSLAAADCLVGLIVMPVSAFYEVTDHIWLFGKDWCDLWRSLDVLFSTASILNLSVISLDRYWAVTDPIAYPMRMTRFRANMLICTVWICAMIVSFPAIIWWRMVRDKPIPDYKCPFTDHLGYLLFSSIVSFYGPLIVMLFTYYKIYRAALAQTKSLRLGTKQVLVEAGQLELTLRMHRGGVRKKLHESSSSNNIFSTLEHHQLPKTFSFSKKLSKFAKEKRAAKTLGIVLGVFIVCWLPFFVVNLLSGFCKDCVMNKDLVFVVVTWLGWINSGMNPVIYACWSKDFRRGFKRILCICSRRKGKSRYRGSNKLAIISQRSSSGVCCSMNSL